MCVFGGGDAGGAAEARAAEEARQGKIREGTAHINSAFSGFDEDFFNGRADALVDFQTPDLQRQYAKAREGLIKALGRSGQLQSSVRGQKFQELDEDFDRQASLIADRGRQAGNDARTAIETARSNLTQTLNATGNARAAQQSSIARASALGQTPAFDTLGVLFQDAAAGIGEGLRAERNGRAGFNSGLFAPSASSARVVA